MAFRNRRRNYPLYQTTHFASFREMTENVAERYPDRVAIGYKLKPTDKQTLTFTYREGRDYIRSIATEFIAMGMQDSKVAIIGEASPYWVFSYFALMSIGAVTVPIDKDLPEADMASIMNTAECSYAVCSPSASPKVLDMREQVPTLKCLISYGDITAEVEGLELLTLEQVRQRGEEKYSAGDRSYHEYEADLDRLASIVFTSGTTGKGKGVMLSVKNICSDMVQGMYNFNVTERTMCVLPPHHTFGSTVNFVGHYAQGCPVYISSGIRYVMNELAEYKPTHLVLVPLFVETFYKKIMTGAEKAGSLEKLQKGIKLSNALRKVGIDLRRKLFGESVLSKFGGCLEMIICGGAALNQEVIDFFESIGVTILNGYGITECAPLISCNRNEYRKAGSVGLPIVGGQVKIREPNEQGEGEICYKGPNVMLGYYNDPVATAEVFDEEGYFRTGDLGKVVTEGKDQWIYITGRAKNLIIFSNGKNVYPEELETDVQGVFGVGEVVVYAGESRSNPKAEVIVAEIYPDWEALKLRGIEDAEAYFNAEVDKINIRNVSYKKIGKVKIRQEEFPKNTSRKITRFKLDKSID